MLAFEPKKTTVPPAVMIDLDTPDATARLADYGAAVQNLRLIRAPGRGVWGTQERRWSEAAVAMDNQGRIPFIFARHPFAMADLNAKPRSQLVHPHWPLTWHLVHLPLLRSSRPLRRVRLHHPRIEF